MVLVPTLSLVVVFGHIPALSSLRLAFTRYNIKQPARRGFVGLDNFILVLTDGAFHAALVRVAYFMAVAIVAVLAIGLVFALVLNRDFRGRATAADGDHHPVGDPAGGVRARMALDLQRRVRRA